VEERLSVNAIMCGDAGTTGRVAEVPQRKIAWRKGDRGGWYGRKDVKNALSIPQILGPSRQECQRGDLGAGKRGKGTRRARGRLAASGGGWTSVSMGLGANR